MSDFSSQTDITFGNWRPEARRQYFDDKTKHRVEADKDREAMTTPEGVQQPLLTLIILPCPSTPPQHTRNNINELVTVSALKSPQMLTLGLGRGGKTLPAANFSQPQPYQFVVNLWRCGLGPVEHWWTQPSHESRYLVPETRPESRVVVWV
jgi:hypothetical protein